MSTRCRLAMLPATMAMGLSFPLASRLFLGDVRKLGSRIGSAYLLANVGSIFGSILAAILLLPLFGTGGGTKIVAAANLALGLFVIAHCRPLSWRRLVPVGGMAGIALALTIVLPKHLPLHGEGIVDVKADHIFVEEGDVATVQVLVDPDRPARRVMTVDGYKIGWSNAFRNSLFCRKQLILAHLPMILDTRIRHTLNVGLGSAATLEALASYADIETLDCVEINQSVANAVELFDSSVVLEDPRVHLVVDDAIHYLLRTEHKYDLIISDGKQQPFYAGNAALLSKEFYEYAFEDLSEDGLFIQWMPLGTLAFDQKVNLNTLCHVFPHVNVFFFPRDSVLTIASRKPLSGRPGMTEDFFVTSDAKAALSQFQLDSVAAIRARWVAGKSQIAPLVADAPVSTWNHLLLDFTSYVADKGLWGRAQTDTLKLLFAAEVAPPVGAVFEPGDDAFVRSTKLLRRACAGYVVGDLAIARLFADRAVAANPNDIVARVVAGSIPGPR
ncbi:MAG: fused MFS/spermidine synthase [Planctomycetes bacterium]|nr:fused MFS/spermidine synthase [Planctomycetota bacterium]